MTIPIMFKFCLRERTCKSRLNNENRSSDWRPAGIALPQRWCGK